MKLLWHESWMDTPGYDAPEVAILIGVVAMVPILRLEHASGRVAHQRPYRKVATFLWTDGPRSTLRKVRTKREEARFTGDFHVAVVYGNALHSGKPVVALGCRVPPAAQQIPVHHRLVREVSDQLSSDELSRIVSSLAAKGEVLCRGNFLYSGAEPPADLVDLFDDALEACSSQTSIPVAGFSAIKPPTDSDEAASTVLNLDPSRRSPKTPVALLGSGDYARTEIIPALRRTGLSLHAVANREPQIAAMVGKKYGFAVATSDSKQAIAELPRPGLVIVATAHDSHAQLATTAVKAGHRAFVEKPPAVTQADVELLVETLTAQPGTIEVGFNRRYHPLILRARSMLQREAGPVSIICTIKEIALESDHWYFWPNQGTRITGNLCHWIDLAVFLLDGKPLPVSITLSPKISGSGSTIDEERVLTVTFEDGSLLTILATSRGDDMRGVQEQIEIRKGHTTIIVDDLWKMRIRSGGLDRFSRTLFRQKAHSNMYRAALRRFLRDEPAKYPLSDIVLVSAIQIAASDLARSAESQCDVPAWLKPALHELPVHV
jgi:predicted dehydrogenase